MLPQFAVTFIALIAFTLAACSADPTATEPKFVHQPAPGSAPGNSVATALAAATRLRSAAVVGAATPAVLEAIAASPSDYACDANDPEKVLCGEYLTEAPQFGAALSPLLEHLETLGADAAVGIAFLNDATKIKNFLWLPPGGIAGNALIGHEERPASVEGPLPYRLNGTDTAIAAATVGLVSARIAEHIFLARAVENAPSAAMAKSMSILLARYAMLVSTP